MNATEHRTQRVASGDVQIFIRRFGKPGATPVLIVHGLSYFSYDWIEVAAALAGDREVVAMDMRGFGDSSFSPKRDYSLPAFAADAKAVLDHLGWRRAVPVGHSMGGRNMAYFAAEHPHRVAGLVLVDYTPENAPAGSRRVAESVAGTPDAFASMDEAMRYFGVDPQHADARQRARYEAYLRPVAGGFAVKRDTHFRDQFRRLIETGERHKLGADMWEVLGRIQAPILALRGKQSDLFAPGSAIKVAAANPRLRLVEVDGGHNMPSDNPQALIRETRAHLAAVDTALAAAAPVFKLTPTRGIDHLAVVTDDMPATMDFYTRVLKMQLVHVRRVPFERDRGQPPYDNLRHYFFDMGNDSLFAVFEYPKGLARQNRDLPGGMQHVAFHVPLDEFDRVVEHVRACGVNVIGPVPLGGRFWSAYFFDPNGIRLEIATSKLESPQGVVESVLQTEEEARAELATLFDDPDTVERWLAQMPLRKEPATAA